MESMNSRWLGWFRNQSTISEWLIGRWVFSVVDGGAIVGMASSGIDKRGWRGGRASEEEDEEEELGIVGEWEDGDEEASEPWAVEEQDIGWSFGK